MQSTYATDIESVNSEKKVQGDAYMHNPICIWNIQERFSLLVCVKDCYMQLFSVERGHCIHHVLLAYLSYLGVKTLEQKHNLNIMFMCHQHLVNVQTLLIYYVIFLLLQCLTHRPQIMCDDCDECNDYNAKVLFAFQFVVCSALLPGSFYTQNQIKLHKIHSIITIAQS